MVRNLNHEFNIVQEEGGDILGNPVPPNSPKLSHTLPLSFHATTMLHNSLSSVTQESRQQERLFLLHAHHCQSEMQHAFKSRSSAL